jgi:hypothetical protein
VGFKFKQEVHAEHCKSSQLGVIAHIILISFVAGLASEFHMRKVDYVVSDHG